jgi:hypothetical protein
MSHVSYHEQHPLTWSHASAVTSHDRKVDARVTTEPT